LIPVKTKSAQTVAADFFDNLAYRRKISGDENAPAALVNIRMLSMRVEKAH